jgi:hypothetical protein
MTISPPTGSSPQARATRTASGTLPLYASSYPRSATETTSACLVLLCQLDTSTFTPRQSPAFLPRCPETFDTMAGQQQQILDTIFNMKKKMLRTDDCKGASLPCWRRANPPQRTRKIQRRPSAAINRTSGAKSTMRAPATQTSSQTRGLTRRYVAAVALHGTLDRRLTLLSASSMPATIDPFYSAILRDTMPTGTLLRSTTNSTRRTTWKR